MKKQVWLTLPAKSIRKRQNSCRLVHRIRAVYVYKSPWLPVSPKTRVGSVSCWSLWWYTGARRWGSPSGANGARFYVGSGGGRRRTVHHHLWDLGVTAGVIPCLLKLDVPPKSFYPFFSPVWKRTGLDRFQCSWQLFILVFYVIGRVIPVVITVSMGFSKHDAKCTFILLCKRPQERELHCVHYCPNVSLKVLGPNSSTPTDSKKWHQCQIGSL